MNLGEIRQRVLDNLGDDGQAWAPPGEAEPYARLDRLINDTIDELSVLIERVDPTFSVKNAMLTLADEAGVDTGIGFKSTASLPVDFRRVVSLWEHAIGIDPQQVNIVAPDRIPYYFGNGESIAYLRQVETDADPNLIETASNEIIFQQRRAGALYYTLWYAARPKSMTKQADVPTIPLEFHYAIVLGSTVRALAQEDSDTRDFRKSYETAKVEMLAALPRRDGSQMAVA